MEEKPDLTLTDQMRRALQEVKRFAFPPPEPTILSVGGRGHYENPTSDLLKFFMSPTGVHGMGTLFLSAFLECMKDLDPACLDLTEVKIMREDATRDLCRIDLLIVGPDWALAIENKIRHWVANDLAIYEDHIRTRLPGISKKYYALLSPEGTAVEDHPNWQPVSYQKYCLALRSKLSSYYLDRPISKWQVFAREFIVNLENEMPSTNKTMTDEQRHFVEKHLQAINDINQLFSSYHSELASKLSDEINKARMSKEALQFRFKPGNDGFLGFLCAWFVEGIHIEFWFWMKPNSEFVSAAWGKGLSDSQFAALPPRAEREEGGYWFGEKPFENKDEAISWLCTLAKQVEHAVLADKDAPT